MIGEAKKEITKINKKRKAKHRSLNSRKGRLMVLLIAKHTN